MPPKISLAHLVLPHPELSNKEACSACLESLVDDRTLIERDASLKPKQRKLQLEKKNGQIKRLYWKTDTSHKSGERYKHFAYCPRQTGDIREACKKAREKQQGSSKAMFSDEDDDAPRKTKVKGKGKVTKKPAKSVPEPTRKSGRESTGKRKYVVESEPEDDEDEDDDMDAEGAVPVSSSGKGKGKQKAEEEEPSEEKLEHADFSEYFAPSPATKRARRASSSASTSADTARSRSSSPDSLFSSRPGSREPSLSTAPTTGSGRTESRSLSAVSTSGAAHVSAGGTATRGKEKSDVDPKLLAAYLGDSSDEAAEEDDDDYDYPADLMTR